MYLSSFLQIFLLSALFCSNCHSHFHLPHLFLLFFVITSLCFFSAPPLTSATPWNLPPFLCTSIPLFPFLFYHLSIHPSIREGDFCSKTLRPSIIPRGKKNAMTLCPWWTQHWFFLSCLSPSSLSPSPLTPSLSLRMCLSPIPPYPFFSSEGRVSIWLSVSCCLSCCPVASIALLCQYIAPLSHANTLMDEHIHPDGPFQATYQTDCFAEPAKNLANMITVNFY